MVLIGAFILPHGSIILDPLKNRKLDGIEELHKAMIESSQILETLKPDLIFLTTPHGLALSHDFGLYLNSKGGGTAEWEGEYKNFQIQIDLDEDITSNLYSFLQDKQVNISGVMSYAPSIEVPLRWGEVVPLWFLRQLSPKLKYLIMSQPTRRHKNALSMIPELLELGKLLKSYFSSLKERIAVVISADLAHTHSVEGPYHYSEYAELFDSLVEQWASTLDSTLLIEKASEYLNQALCCGYVGMVILQGLLGGLDVEPKVTIRSNPTYYGMLVARFTMRPEEEQNPK